VPRGLDRLQGKRSQPTQRPPNGLCRLCQLPEPFPRPVRSARCVRLPLEASTAQAGGTGKGGGHQGLDAAGTGRRGRGLRSVVVVMAGGRDLGGGG